MNRALRFAVLQRDGFTCQYCGASAPGVTLEVDHMVPRSCGGKDEFENLIAACFDCNRGKGALRCWGKGKQTAASVLRRRERELFDLANEAFRATVADLVRHYEPGDLAWDDPRLDSELMFSYIGQGLRFHDIRQAIGAVERYRRARFATIERLQNVFYDNCEHRLGYEALN